MFEDAVSICSDFLKFCDFIFFSCVFAQQTFQIEFQGCVKVCSMQMETSCYKNISTY